MNMASLKILYLNLIRIYGIDPNFFISSTYLSQEGIKAYMENNWVWLEESGQPLFPALPLYMTKESDVWDFPYVKDYWCGFDGDVGNEWMRLKDKQFLDYQYLYDPKNFINLSGGKWESFRKNVRKFLKRYHNYAYNTKRDYDDVRILLGEWLKKHRENVQDAEFIINCILTPSRDSEVYVKCLYDENGTLLAINWADENYKYINYRFVITNGEPYVDEFARYCFYTDIVIQQKNKLVNDGGCLGFKGLEKFKDKLNPVKKIKMYSWNNKLKQ